MKKFFTLSALFALLTFVGCSSDDDEFSISGGTPYSGDLVGTWVLTEVDEYAVTLTLSSNGNFVCNYVDYEYTDDWCIDYGLIFVKDDNLALQYMKGKDCDGSYDLYEEYGEYDYEYYYIGDVTSEYAELGGIDGNCGTEVDFDYAETCLGRYGYSSFDIFYKK